jgi:hypothetical protein
LAGFLQVVAAVIVSGIQVIRLPTLMAAIQQSATRLVSNRRLQPTVTISDYESEMFCVR